MIKFDRTALKIQTEFQYSLRGDIYFVISKLAAAVCCFQKGLMYAPGMKKKILAHFFFFFYFGRVFILMQVR